MVRMAREVCIKELSDVKIKECFEGELMVFSKDGKPRRTHYKTMYNGGFVEISTYPEGCYILEVNAKNMEVAFKIAKKAAKKLKRKVYRELKK